MMIRNLLLLAVFVGGCESLKGLPSEKSAFSESVKITREKTQVPATVDLASCERFKGEFTTKEDSGPAGGFVSSCRIQGSSGKKRDLNCKDVGGEPVLEKAMGSSRPKSRSYCAIEIPGEPFFREMTCKDYGGRDLSYTDDETGSETVYKCVFDDKAKVQQESGRI